MMFSLFWAFQIFVAKLGFNKGALALPFQAYMLLSATITLAILVWPKSGSEMVTVYKENKPLFWKLYFANAIQSGLGTYLSIVGFAMTAAINAGFLVKTATVTTIIFAWIFLKEKMSFLKFAVIVIALSGAYLLTTKGQALLPQIGDLFIIGAAVCWSFGSVVVRKILKEQSISADVVTLQKPLAGIPVFLGLVGLSILFADQLGNLGEIIDCCSFSASYIPYALVSGFCQAMAWIFIYRTLAVSTASYMTLMSMATPIIVSILAIVFLNETLVPIQILGAGMILSSGVLIYFSDISKT